MRPIGGDDRLCLSGITASLLTEPIIRPVPSGYKWSSQLCMTTSPARSSSSSTEKLGYGTAARLHECPELFTDDARYWMGGGVLRSATV